MYTVSVWKIQAMCAVITKQQTLIYRFRFLGLGLDVNISCTFAHIY
jgi:hypothetical protein